MPPKRSYRKRTNRRKSTYRKRGSRRTGGILIKRTCALAPVVAAGVFTSNQLQDSTANQFGYFNFSLSDLPNNGEITAMFNQYKITGVKLRFIPMQGTETSPGSTNLMNALAVQVDKSVRGVPASFDEIIEASNAKVFSAAQKGFSIWISRPLAAATIASSSALLTNSWIDSDKTDAKHYGLRYAFQNGYASVYTRFMAYATYYVRVKGMK